MKVVPPAKPVDQWTKEEVMADWRSLKRRVNTAVARQALEWRCGREYVRTVLLADALGVNGRRDRAIPPPRKQIRLVKPS